MSVIKEFRAFIAQGNVIDLAVGVVIGGAFGKIVTALVDGVIMPVIGLLLSGVDFSSLKIVLRQADPARKAAEVAIAYGAFVNAFVQFLIVAAAVFFMVRLVNSARRLAETPAEPAPEPQAPVATPSEALLAEIRDLLAARKGQS